MRQWGPIRRAEILVDYGMPVRCRRWVLTVTIPPTTVPRHFQDLFAEIWSSLVRPRYWETSHTQQSGRKNFDSSNQWGYKWRKPERSAVEIWETWDLGTWISQCLTDCETLKDPNLGHWSKTEISNATRGLSRVLHEMSSPIISPQIALRSGHRHHPDL